MFPLFLCFYIGYRNLIDLGEADILKNYLKIRRELSEYSDILSSKKEVIIFNKSDLFEQKDIDKKLKIFKNKIKNKFEIISFFSKKDLIKIKRILLKNA